MDRGRYRDHGTGSGPDAPGVDWIGSHPWEDEMAQRERRQVPEVRRPRGVAWRSLQADGLVWEGQVFLVGADFDMAARMIVTRERIALVRGGGIILEATRDWLRPAPRLLPDGNVLLSITPDSAPGTAGAPETLLLRMREGRGDASHLVTLLGGGRSRRGVSRAPALAPRPLPVVPVDADDPLDWARPASRSAQASAGPVDRAGRPAAQDAPWSRSRRQQPPIDVPVATVSGAAAGATATPAGSEPYVLPPPKSPEPSGRYYDWNLPPDEVVSSRGSRRRRGWLLRLGGLLTLILAAVTVAALASNRDPGDRTLEGARVTVPAGVGGLAGPASPIATATSAATGSDTVTATAAAAAAPSNEPGDDLPAAGNEQTAVALGVGSDLSPTSTTAPVQAPPALPTDAVATATPAKDVAAQAVTETATPTATPNATVTTVATEEPQPSPTPADVATQPVKEPVVTSAPMIATIATATATPVVAPTETAPPTATEEPATATEGATEPPVTATATATQAREPTETPVPEPTETPAPTEPPAFPTQLASVAEEGYTAPAFEEGAFRITIESTMKGPALPSLGLPDNPYGDWLVAVVYVYNWSDSPANFAMPDFGLVTADPAVSFMPLDSGTSLVGSTLGFKLPLGSTDVVALTPGEGYRIGLLFTADPLGSGFSLAYGAAVAGLQSSLEASPNATELGAAPSNPDLLETSVTGVVDGDTITVEIDGIETTVTYAGVRAPAPDACYGPESTDANAAIVAAGDTVYLEREATDETKDGALLRDVWIDLDGASVLVANQLAAVGAVDVLSGTPNDRFTSWLEVTVANAAFTGEGLWSACGGEVGDGSGGPAAVAAPANGFALLPRPPALGGEG